LETKRAWGWDEEEATAGDWAWWLFEEAELKEVEGERW
jgi:hypothetical protein